MGGCAGVLIADRWVLTAAHCKLIRARAPDHMSVVINEHEIFTDVSAIGQQHPPSHPPPSHKSSYFFELTREHVNYCLTDFVIQRGIPTLWQLIFSTKTFGGLGRYPLPSHLWTGNSLPPVPRDLPRHPLANLLVLGNINPNTSPLKAV